MKMKSLLIAAFVVLCSSVAFAGEGEPRNTGFVVVPVKDKKVFKIIYKSESVGNVKLKIYSESGAVVYSETISGMKGFIYPMNFTGLSSGKYSIELTDSVGKKVETVSYATK